MPRSSSSSWRVPRQSSSQVPSILTFRFLRRSATIGYKELKRTGVFLVPGFAKFVVIKKPATKERQGTNPFTKEPMTFKAKPARKIVRARPVKAAKDAV